MKARASVLIAYVRGIPVYAHLTLPIGMLLVSGFAFRPWSWLGLIAIVVVHELGHAFLLRRYGLPVLSIVLHGFGGECRTVDYITPWQRSVVAWGGGSAKGSVTLPARPWARKYVRSRSRASSLALRR